MAVTNELDAALCQGSIPDEFSGLASSSPPRDKSSLALALSGVIPARQQDGVMCPLMLRRRLLVPAWQDGQVGRMGHRV